MQNALKTMRVELTTDGADLARALRYERESWDLWFTGSYSDLQQSDDAAPSDGILILDVRSMSDDAVLAILDRRFVSARTILLVHDAEQDLSSIFQKTSFGGDLDATTRRRGPFPRSLLADA